MKPLPLLLILLVSPLARADVDPDTEAAKRHFQAGLKHYAVDDYAGALKEFQVARELKPLPAFDYNIARCHDRLEHYPEAIKEYERYVRGAPDPFDAADAQARLDVLRKRMAARRAVATPKPRPRPIEPAESPPAQTPAKAASSPPASIVAPPADAPPSPEAPSRPFPTAPLAIGAVALALVAVGGGLIGAANSTFGSLNCAPNCRLDQVSPIRDDLYAGDALVVIGAALAATDIGLWIYWSRSVHPDRRISLVPFGRGLGLRGSF